MKEQRSIPARADWLKTPLLRSPYEERSTIANERPNGDRYGR